MPFLGLVKRVGRHLRRRNLARVVFSLSLAVTTTALFLYILLAYHLADDPHLVPEAFRRARNILLVTAHPDDETLFFSPSITYRRQDPHVNRALLALSSGNYEGLGEERRTEIHGSCTQLGISLDRCVVLDRAELQDNPRKWWDEDLIKDLVASYVATWQVDLILTFDDGGVSGHINHRSVSAGVRKYVTTTPQAPPAYALQSTFLLQKYSSLLDLIPTTIPFSWRILRAVLTRPWIGREVASAGHDPVLLDSYDDKALLVSSWPTYLVSRAAFSRHVSQYSWDRVLYLVVSRYMWFNNFKRIG